MFASMLQQLDLFWCVLLLVFRRTFCHLKCLEVSIRLPVLFDPMAEPHCEFCWSAGTPYHWSRATAPHIPQTKPELVEALKPSWSVAASLKVGEKLEAMTLPELKALYKTHIKGEPHPHDPTRGFPKLNQDDLIERLKKHCLPVVPRMSKGNRMLLLRSHWDNQCKLAHPDSPEPSKDFFEDWEEISDSLDDFLSVRQKMGDVLEALMGECAHSSQDDPLKSLEPLVRKAEHSFESFVDATSALIAARKALQQQ